MLHPPLSPEINRSLKNIRIATYDLFSKNLFDPLTTHHNDTVTRKHLWFFPSFAQCRSRASAFLSISVAKIERLFLYTHLCVCALPRVRRYFGLASTKGRGAHRLFVCVSVCAHHGCANDGIARELALGDSRKLLNRYGVCKCARVDEVNLAKVLLPLSRSLSSCFQPPRSKRIDFFNRPNFFKSILVRIS